MSDLLAQMEASGLGTWVRESPSIWAYPTILTLHSIGLGIVVGASMIIDLRLIGRARALEMADLSALFPVIWWAFAVNALTGVLLFIADATRKSATADLLREAGVHRSRAGRDPSRTFDGGGLERPPEAPRRRYWPSCRSCSGSARLPPDA